uniref:GRAM domain-containing protein n=1 Tax=Kryptolebias marmoratus TaxID=37003 RepID=A0A3Q2ZKY0_KRYMA
ASSTASNSPRSTPGSSPSLRRRVLGGGKASESEGGGERSSGGGGGGGGGSDSPLPSLPSASSLSSAYPLASRHFSRNAKVLSPTYKQRNEDFRKIFKKLPDTERLIVDYSCALQKDILLQGRLYLSENWLCFYSNIFRWETTITILLKDVTSITKEKTAKLIPNAIQISTENDKVGPEPAPGPAGRWAPGQNQFPPHQEAGSAQNQWSPVLPARTARCLPPPPPTPQLLLPSS